MSFRFLCVLFSAMVLIGGALTGCRSEKTPVETSASAQPAPAPAAPPPPPADPAKIRANEAGMIPVVMYHSVGDPPARRGGPRYDRRGLNIAPETFRKHLEMMHEAGWYPVNMRDALTARMEVPAGKTPVVLTFDDGRGSQFRYLPDGSIDPDCVVGILEAFNRRHPDWPLRGTFYLNSNRNNPVPFWQRGKEAQKIQYMLAKGFEIGNHSSTHSSMANMSAARLQWEVADCIRYIKRLAPNATMDTFCLPYGAWPRNRALLGVLMEGSEGGTSYRNLAVLNAWGGPTYPPAHRKFDPRAVSRIGVDPGYLEMWIKNLKAGKSLHPYISDGDPNTVSAPRSAERWVAVNRLEGARLVIYEDGAPKPETGKREKAPKERRKPRPLSVQ